MTLTGAHNVFPLPLTTFEKYMLADDRPDYPMTLIRQLLVSGRIQRAAFETAILKTLSQHPLLNAVVDRSHPSRPVWTDAGRSPCGVDWADIREPLLRTGEEFIDLARDPGFRVWVRQADAAAVVTLQFHHACCDGLGAMQFIAGLLTSYASEIQQEVPGEASPVRHCGGLLALRGGVFSGKREPSVRVKVSLVSKMVRTARFLFRKPTPLLPSREAASSPAAPTTIPHVLSYAMGRADLEQLRRAAKKSGATLNDWLLRDLFRVVRDWNRENSTGAAGRWLRILMPVNLRSEKHQAIPAANIMSYGFVTRDERICDGSAKFLDGIVRETREIKYGGLALRFLEGAAIVLRIPGNAGRMASREKTHTTVVLSNVGEVTERLATDLPRRDGKVVAGNVILEAVRGFPPPRRNTNVVVHVMTYAGRMTVATRVDPRVLGAVDAHEILSRYVRQLRVSSSSDEQPVRQDGLKEPQIEAWEDIAASWNGVMAYPKVA